MRYTVAPHCLAQFPDKFQIPMRGNETSRQRNWISLAGIHPFQIPMRGNEQVREVVEHIQWNQFGFKSP